jgi:cytochrome c oxidase subunit 2
MVTGWPNLSNPADNVFLFIAVVSVVLLAGITGTMIFFAVKYRRSRNPRPEDIEGNVFLEIVWTVVPTLIVLAMFYAGWKGFLVQRTVPKDAMLVKVTARQWAWDFEYENGTKSGVLNVPLGRPVKLSMTSLDVIHSLFIPAFRVKEDTVPGMETYLWFRPETTGSYDLFCAEYCGVGHAVMITKVAVMPQEEFDSWYRSAAPPPVEKKGKPVDAEKLLQEKGCIACHSTDGTAKVGPTFKGLYGRKVTVVTAGKEREITAGDDYIRRSIKEPQADIVKGFPPVMPAMPLSDEELDAIIEHLETMK